MKNVSPRRYGYWRPITDEVVEKYLMCGDPHHGFARIRCEECFAEYLRAFSCKCRGFCPACSKWKSLDLVIFLEEELFRPMTHRHGPPQMRTIPINVSISPE